MTCMIHFRSIRGSRTICVIGQPLRTAPETSQRIVPDPSEYGSIFSQTLPSLQCGFHETALQRLEEISSRRKQQFGQHSDLHRSKMAASHECAGRLDITIRPAGVILPCE